MDVARGGVALRVQAGRQRQVGDLGAADEHERVARVVHAGTADGQLGWQFSRATSSAERGSPQHPQVTVVIASVIAHPLAVRPTLADRAGTRQLGEHAADPRSRELRSVDPGDGEAARRQQRRHRRGVGGAVVPGGG